MTSLGNLTQVSLPVIAVLVLVNTVLFLIARRRRRDMSLSEWRAAMRRQGIGIGEPCGYYLIEPPGEPGGAWIAYNPYDQCNCQVFLIEQDARAFQTRAIENYLTQHGVRMKRGNDLRIVAK